MNAETFARLFERFGDVPEAVPRLRRFVLDLAVRGRLVRQDTADEPANKLLGRINVDFARLVDEGRLNRPKPVLPITVDDELFPAPRGWAFARFGNVVAIQSNLVDPKHHPDLPHIAPDNIEGWTARLLPFVTVRESEVFSGKHHFVAGSVLYSKIRPNLAKVARVEFDGLCSADMYPLHPLIDPEFLVAFMITPAFVSQAVSEDNRVAMPKINQAALSNIVVPIPPIAEQRRIVAKVNELAAPCDRLEAARAERETKRDRLATASLARLSAPDPETFPADARFALDTLSAVTARPDQVKLLRQTILHLAIRGKLAPQEPADEPVAALLARIRADKRQREDGGSGRKAVPALGPESVPYQTPPSWSWLRLGDVIVCRDGERVPVSKDERSGRAKVYDYYGASGAIDKIDGFLFDKPLLLIGEDGANLLNRSTPIAFIARGKYWVNNHAHVIDAVDEALLLYLELYVNATDLRPYITGTAQPKMNQAKMNSIPIAVPPEAEQRRIVAKVQELTALCDRLEAGLVAATAARRGLLEAALRDALQPVAA